MAYSWSETITQGTDIEFGDFIEIRDVVDTCNDGCYTHYVAENSNHDSDHDASHYSSNDGAANSSDDASHYSANESSHDTTFDATHYATELSDHDTTHYVTHYSSHNGARYSYYNPTYKVYDGAQSHGEGC